MKVAEFDNLGAVVLVLGQFHVEFVGNFERH